MSRAMNPLSSRRKAAAPRRDAGFSLIELMIASTIGLLILTAMVSVFVNSVQSRNEVDKSSRQIENGRYAVQMLREDIQLAAFYGDYFPPKPPSVAAPTWTTPDPCSLILNNMGMTGTNLPVGIYGYPDTVIAGATAETPPDGVHEPSCLSNRKSGTDVLVIHRASTTQLIIDADGNGAIDSNVTNEDGSSGVSVASLNGGYYVQVSNCADTPAEAAYVMAKSTASFVLHGVKPAGVPPNCMNGGLAHVRQYMVRIFYVATCNVCTGLTADTIPTLKMVELTPGTSSCATNPAASCGSMTTRAIAEGIENLQFEYGIDTSGDGTPDSFSAAPAATDWPNVTTVKIFLLARNTEISAGYTDTKTYSLASDGSTLADTPFNDQYKRHVYVAMARAINIANRK